MLSYFTLIVPPFQTHHKQTACPCIPADPVLLRKVNVEVVNKTFFGGNVKVLFLHIYSISAIKK